MSNAKYDAVVVGAGPNGLAAAIALALQSLSVLLVEEKATIGGGCRSEELTLPGYIHDVCSSIHPLAIGSPFFRKLPLSTEELEWIHPSVPLAHPFDDGTCALLQRSVEKTCESLGEDCSSYHQLLSPFVDNWWKLENTFLGPLTFPSHPLLALQFGLKGIRSAESLAKGCFKNPKTQGLFAGLAAHSILPLDQSMTAAVGLLLSIAGHVFGWPMPRGGAQSIAAALGSYFQSLGGKIQTEFEVTTIKDLPSSRVILFDLTPRQILKIAGDELTPFYTRQLEKYRYGPGVFKMDWALSRPIPWKAKACHRAGTVHLGGSFDQIAASEKAVWEGKHPETPYVLAAQHSLFDHSRAPDGKHTAWAYCHVPHGSKKDMSLAIENQIERFAPGFRDCILGKSTKNTDEMRQFNSNYIGGDIIGGVQDLRQLFTRPTKRLVPYATSNPQIFICSSSTPPGGGVHGMCGYHAAKVVLKRVFGIR
ncbi:MAG: NAD(P)/FAD-dependent oxidoreductase [Waddliaceae bacterium]